MSTRTTSRSRASCSPARRSATASGAGACTWVAAIAAPHVSYAQIGIALTIAGTGTSFCFPTVANAIIGSVPLKEAGIASGTNSTLRELGGVLGVAVLATVFTRHGVYGSQRAFVAGFTQALWVAVAFSGLGVVAALRSARRPSARDEAATLPADVALERGAA